MNHYDYLEMFLEESNDHLKTMNEQLFLLEQAPEDKQILAEIFRSAHTLKGMSASMGFEEMANLTHSLENVLDQMREEVIEADEQWIDLFLKVVDILEQSLNENSHYGER
ncbi:Hpt domain-containing protein, partial [Bacillus sp. JCM 19041]|uniref:Hpt domain-containing protein n=1 Tax=Bacillus sp. JCM 19041 TaxID=1460637 RepID=UPI000AB5DCFE